MENPLPIANAPRTPVTLGDHLDVGELEAEVRGDHPERDLLTCRERSEEQIS